MHAAGLVLCCYWLIHLIEFFGNIFLNVDVPYHGEFLEYKRAKLRSHKLNRNTNTLLKGGINYALSGNYQEARRTFKKK